VGTVELKIVSEVGTEGGLLNHFVSEVGTAALKLPRVRVDR
jgi:hypothetical protein